MKNNQLSTKDALTVTYPIVSPVNFPKILEENVGNFCPVCGKTILSNLLEIDEKVYLEKNCCTKELVFIENDINFFLKYKKNTTITPFAPDAKNYEEAMFKNPNRGVSVVSLYDITMRCNMDCPICYWKFKCNHFIENQKIDVPLEKIKEGIRRYKGKVIYLLGGEPTLREDLCDIIKAIKDSGNIPGIVTNGLKLEDENYLNRLKKAGLKVISIQFDGFNKEVNKKLRGHDYLEKRIKILKNIEKVGGFRVLLACVIGKKLNEEEIRNTIEFAVKNKFIDMIQFLGLTFEEAEHEMTPSRSDMLKIMEKENYFDSEYFLETVRMRRNMNETAIKIFGKTPLENLIFKKLPSYFDVILFKVKSGSPQLFFTKNDLDKINNVLEDALKKKSKIGTIFSLLKNSGKMIKSPLPTIFIKKIFLSRNPASSSFNDLLEIGFFGRARNSKNQFLNANRGIVGFVLMGAEISNSQLVWSGPL